MLPTVKHHTPTAKVGVCYIQTIESICHTIASLIPLSHNGSSHR